MLTVFVIAAHFAEGETLSIPNCTWFTITVLHTLSLKYMKVLYYYHVVYYTSLGLFYMSL